MTKKDVFVAEDLLLHGIGDEAIFVTQASQIMKYNKNSTFNDINRTSQKPTLLHIVLLASFCSALFLLVSINLLLFPLYAFVALCRRSGSRRTS